MRTIAWVMLLGTVASADDWPQFRGPAGTGVSAEKAAPVEWGPQKNVLWRTPIAGTGNSSPIVSKGRVFITVAEDKGRKRSLMCLDRASGKALWTRTVEVADVEPTQQDNPYCGSTPCADGERVIVWHATAGLFCYDLEGKPLWTRDLGKVVHMWGYGPSPVLLGDRVLLNVGPGDRTFLASIDKKTGEVAWKAEESGGDGTKWIGSWATPVVVKDQILLGYPSHVNAYDPATGKVIWTCGGLGKLVYADVVAGGGFGVATGEDEGGDSIAFRLGGSGDVTSTHRLWAHPRPLEVSTGQILDGKLWAVDNNGILRCTDVESGKDLLKERFPGAAWGSMILAGGRAYVTTRAGDTVVFAPDPKKFEPLAVNRLGEPSNATPAISDGDLFLRTSKAVYCIRERH